MELEGIKPPSVDEVGITELLELDVGAGGMTGTEVVELPDEGKRALVNSEGKMPEVGKMPIELEDECVDSGTLIGIVGRSSKLLELLEDVGTEPVEDEDSSGKRPESKPPDVLVDVGTGVFDVEDEVPSRPPNKLPEVDVAPVVVLEVDVEESPPRPKLRPIRGSDEVEVAVGDV